LKNLLALQFFAFSVSRVLIAVTVRVKKQWNRWQVLPASTLGTNQNHIPLRALLPNVSFGIIIITIIMTIIMITVISVCA